MFVCRPDVCGLQPRKVRLPVAGAEAFLLIHLHSNMGTCKTSCILESISAPILRPDSVDDVEVVCGQVCVTSFPCCSSDRKRNPTLLATRPTNPGKNAVTRAISDGACEGA